MAEEVQGLKHFTDYFSKLNQQFVIIGGIATNYFLLASDLVGRRTKDIDLVVLANPNQIFASHLRECITMGRYQIEGDAAGKSRNFRFRNPQIVEFPKQIEIFSPAPLNLQLREDQRIVPFITSSGLESLSAILMDADYFGLVTSTNVVRDGMPLLTSDGLVPLKVRAFLDLDSRRKRGEQVDHGDTKKHRNDVLRLTQTFTLESFEVAESIKIDLRSFIRHPEILGLDSAMIASIVPGTSGLDQVLNQLVEHYKL